MLFTVEKKEFEVVELNSTVLEKLKNAGFRRVETVYTKAMFTNDKANNIYFNVDGTIDWQICDSKTIRNKNDIKEYKEKLLAEINKVEKLLEELINE